MKISTAKKLSLILLSAALSASLFGCAPTAAAPASSDAAATPAPAAAAPATEPAAAPANADPINVVWYPNESSDTHTEVRAEVNRLITEATGREAKEVLTTDYTIAIEALATGSADIAMAMGAVGYIEAKDRNPEVDVLFVNSDAEGGLDGAKYFSWLAVMNENAEAYKSGDTFAIDNIKGKTMSFVSNSSTSGFRVPTTSIIEHFAADALTEDDLVEGGSDKFFAEVAFGGTHQGSAVNLISGVTEVAAFCDVELMPFYAELASGELNTVGATYKIKADAEAPFDQYAGAEFTSIACTPVFNGPCAYNPAHLSADEIQAIRDLFTSDVVSNNEFLFFDDSVEGATGMYKKSASAGYVLTEDSWYDAYRQ